MEYRIYINTAEVTGNTVGGFPIVEREEVKASRDTADRPISGQHVWVRLPDGTHPRILGHWSLRRADRL